MEIIGDVPIYVAFDSSDAWANPEMLQFNEEYIPIAVAGCPPDAFLLSDSSGEILFMTGKN